MSATAGSAQGINVGGKGKPPMADLPATAEGCGKVAREVNLPPTT